MDLCFSLRPILHIVLGVILLMAIALPVHAANICRTINQHQICILDIKRSAKNYWEYRATVSLDGERKPEEVYNCRDRTTIQEDGTVVRFESDGAGAMICRLLNR